MALKSKDLSVLAYANGFTLWHYTTTDTAATMDTVGYFNDVANQLRVGDIVIGNTETDATAKTGLFVISANAAGVVDANDMTQIGSADTD